MQAAAVFVPAAVAAGVSSIGFACLASLPVACQLVPLALSDQPQAEDGPGPDYLGTATVTGLTGHSRHVHVVSLAMAVFGVALLAPLAVRLAAQALSSSSSSSAAAAAADDVAAIRHLYLSHWLGAFGDRMEQIAVPMLFMDLFQTSLLSTALYAALVYLSVVVFMPRVGAWVDARPRLYVQQTACLLESASIAAASALLCAVAANDSALGPDAPPPSLSDASTLAWFVSMVLLGCLEELMSGASTLSVEKDWVVVISSASGFPLGVLNRQMRRIDLCCKALAPALFALLYQLLGSGRHTRVFYGSAVIGLWNVLALPMVLSLNRQVFFAFPRLDCKAHAHQDGTRHAHRGGHLAHAHPLLLVPVRSPGASPRPSNSPSHSPSHSPSYPNSYSAATPTPTQHLQHSQHAQQQQHQQEQQHRHLSGGVAHSHAHAHGGTAHEHVKAIAVGDNLSAAAAEEVDITSFPPLLWPRPDAPLLLNESVPSASASAGVLSSLRLGARLYASHELFLASLAYTLLYMTVLDGGALMTAYLLWSGVHPAVFGAGRAVGALFGLMGTFAYPRLLKGTRRSGRGLSVEAAGLVSIWAFVGFLAPIGLTLLSSDEIGNGGIYGDKSKSIDDVTGVNGSFSSYSHSRAAVTMVACVAASRMWLWSFDLAVTELCQTKVKEEHRGLFGSVQASSYQFFFIVVQALGVASPDPRHFERLVHFSLLVVLAAAAVYTAWFLRTTAADNQDVKCAAGVQTEAEANDDDIGREGEGEGEGGGGGGEEEREREERRPLLPRAAP